MGEELAVAITAQAQDGEANKAAIAALGARRDVLVNQFPGEEALVFKHLLPRTAAAAVCVALACCALAAASAA